MADLIPLDSAVMAGAGATSFDAISGEALTAGQSVYLDGSDQDENGQGKAKGALAAGSLEQATVRGILLNNAAGPNQPVRILRQGQIQFGVAVAQGEIYVVSVNAGGIAPAGDLVATNRVAILGIAIDATFLDVQLNAPGTQKA